jgi:hypothetical protein
LDGDRRSNPSALPASRVPGLAARRRREALARTADADDALRLVASYRMPEERSKSRGNDSTISPGAPGRTRTCNLLLRR